MTIHKTQVDTVEEQRHPYSEKQMDQLDHIMDRVDKIYDAVYGNGNPGLKTEMMLNKDFRVRYQRMFDNLTLKIAGMLLIGSLAGAGVMYWITKIG